MPEELNLDLDIASFRRGEGQERVVRVGVVRAFGYTKDGGAPTITRDCRSYQELEREVGRLRQDLEGLLARARSIYDVEGESKAEAPEAPARMEGRSAAPKKKLADAGRLRVADVMTREVRTVGRNDELSVADELMKVGGFRHVVVVDDAGQVAGVISHRDVFYGALAWSMGLGTAAHEKALEAYPVKQVMQASVVSVDSRTPLSDAATLMLERRIGCLPVIDGGNLVGILTEGDVLALLSGQ
ncbi:MAG: CBS domain-containing protein [Myxococcota bacterium]